MREFHELAQLCLRTLAKKGWVSQNHSDSHFPSLFHFQPITVCHLAFLVLCTCNPPSTTIYFKNPFDLSVWFCVIVFHQVFLDSAHALQTSIPNLRWDVRKLKVLFYSKFSMQVNSEFLCGVLPEPEDPLFPFTFLSFILTAQAWLLFLPQIQWWKRTYKFILYLFIWSLMFDFSCSVNYKELGRRASSANTIGPLEFVVCGLGDKGTLLILSHWPTVAGPKWLQMLDDKRQCLLSLFMHSVTLKYWKAVSSFIAIVGKVHYSH